MMEPIRFRDIFRARLDGRGIVDGSAVRVPLPERGFFTHPMISPDGRQVICWGITTAGWDIWFADPDAGRATNLTAGSGTNCHPAWSPDGSRIVYSCSPEPADSAEAYVHPWSAGKEHPWRELWVLDIGTGENRQVSRFGFDAERPSWSPDGRQIACAAGLPGQKRIWILDLKLEQAHPVTPPDMAAYRPVWHPSGTRLAFNTKGSGSHLLWQTGSEGSSLKQLTVCGADEHTVHDHGAWWFRDGTAVLFHSDRGGCWRLWELLTEEGTILPIAGSAAASHGTLSLDESFITYDMAREGCAAL